MMKTVLKRGISFLLCLWICAFPVFQAFGVQAVEPIEFTRVSDAHLLSAQALAAEIDAMPTTGALRNAKVDLTGFTQSADGSNDLTGLKGRHYLIRSEADKFYALDATWTGTNGNLPLRAATISGYSVVSGVNPYVSFEFHYRGLASNGMPLYVLRLNNGRNISVGTQYSDWKELYYVKADTTTDLAKAPTVRLDHANGVTWVRFSTANGSHGLRQASDMSGFRWKDNSAGDNDYQGNVLELYRPWSTREIIAAIHEMRSYLDTPEFYEEDVFNQFLTCMREAITLYRKYNPNPSAPIDPYDFVQEKLDQKITELYGFKDRLAFEIETPSNLNATTKIHQLPIACGYVIQTREGKIIIIDGGTQDGNREGNYLFSYLQKITGDSTPHIDAWFITHAHADHHGCVPTFAELYKDQVTIDAFYYHYPTYEQIQKYLSGCGVNDTWGAVDWIPTWLMPNFKNAEGGPTKGVICNTAHSGLCNNSFDFDEVHIDILLTFDDVAWAADNVSGRYSGTSANEGRVFSNKTFKELLNDNMNETSMVFRVTVGGKNVLFTGDINYIGGYMLNKFHDANAKDSSVYYSIKSDYVQVSHHGHYGLPKNSYNRIDPDVAMWPIYSSEWYDYDYQNLACTKQWFNDMGATSYLAFQGPQTFEFPLVRTEGAVTVPPELKSYVFDAAYYSAKYPDLAKLYGTDERKLYYHFLTYGIEEGRSASPYFDVRYYANQNGAALRDTLKGNYIAAFQDFLSKYKTNTLLKLSVNFDAKFYATKHTNLTTMFDLLKEYVANGASERASTVHASDDGRSYHTNCTYTEAASPTCTANGRTEGVKCNACGLEFAKSITLPAIGHTKVVDEAVPATCTTDGMTAGSHCSVCNAVIEAQKVVPAAGHKEVVLPAVAATCTTSGLTEGRHCSVCNQVFAVQETIPATGHSYDDGHVTAATCTQDGVRTYTCQTCGHKKTEVITAEGHQPVTITGTAPTCVNSGTTDHVYCSVCNAILQAAEVLPRLGHDYSNYMNNGDTHTATCSRCNKTSTANHSYTKGTCICGAKEILPPVLDESIKILHTLDLASDISVTFAVQKTALANYDSYYLECVLPEYNGNTLVGTSTVEVQPVVSGNYYYFTLTGITAVRMGDMVDAVLHMTKGTQKYISKTDSYSVATYAYGMLNSSKDAKMLTLCADLLRYGAEAQAFKGYRTDALVDADMTEVHRSYLSNTEALSFTATDSYLGDIANPTITWVGKTLDLGSKVGMKFVFNAKNYTGDLSKLSMKVTYQGSTGETKSVTVTGIETYNAANKQYSFTFYGLLASELRTIVDVAIYNGNTQLSETLRYSAESYAAKTGTTALAALTKALFAYSDSAKSFFVK